MDIEINIIPIPEFFEGTGEVKGFTYQRVFEEENYYIYEVNPGEGRIHYEVIRRKAQPALIDFATRTYSETEYKESYPRSKRFGIEGWSLPTLEAAREKIRKLYTDSNIKHR
jgi:hypothetical protein